MEAHDAASAPSKVTFRQGQVAMNPAPPQGDIDGHNRDLVYVRNLESARERREELPPG